MENKGKGSKRKAKVQITPATRPFSALAHRMPKLAARFGFSGNLAPNDAVVDGVG
jgi:hypothetical protein